MDWIEIGTRTQGMQEGLAACRRSGAQKYVHINNELIVRENQSQIGPCNDS